METSYRQAVALADELGMRPLVARSHLGLGKLCRRTGNHSKAQEHLTTAEEHLTTAATLLREMDMRFWLAEAEAEVKELE